ncbi:hypothetical protein ACK8N7_01485 [Streptomyces griseobrunneus]
MSEQHGVVDDAGVPPSLPVPRPARATLLKLARDEDRAERDEAGRALTAAHNGSAGSTDAIVALLRDPGGRCAGLLRLLPRRDDPRTGEAIARVGPHVRPGYEHDHGIAAFGRWEWDKP